MSESKVPENASAHLSALSEEEKAVVQLLLRLDQTHLLAVLPAAPTDDSVRDLKRLLQQVKHLDSQFPGGLQAYVENARKLLQEAKLGKNPFENYRPEVPQGERLQVSSADFKSMEERGVAELACSCFVLVAGGLGERLGYNGIKLSLPSDTVTEHCFLQLYVRHILAMQQRAIQVTGDGSIKLPLVIMTSDDTHARTVALLADHHNFGMSDGQITILKQEKVAAIYDNAGHIATEPNDPYTIITKPHGHGDVHVLLHQSGLVRRWESEGRRWILFFQDTNGLVFHGVPAMLGVSAAHNFHVNSMTVPRQPGEAVGGICKLVATGQDNGATTMTVNVEYNQLDDLLRCTVNPNGDEPDPQTGFSPFPGNTNVLLFAVAPYVRCLERTNGTIAEFINPKYKDASKEEFKAPTRLECMMQDYPKQLSPEDPVGFTEMERWLCFSAVKNNLGDAAARAGKNLPPECASSGEADVYKLYRTLLQRIGVQVNVQGPTATYGNIPVDVGARVLLAPSMAVTVADVAAKFPNPSAVSISDRSTLLLDGPDIVVESLQLNGSLVVRAVPGARVTIRGLKVENDGDRLQPVNSDDSSVPEAMRIRGYVLQTLQRKTVSYDAPGDYVLSE